jgi:N4-gp56 family major capsid protein
MKKRMPKNGGRFLRMSRYEQLPTAPVPLGNTGVTPPSTALNRVDLDVLMQFYGQFVILNEQVTLQNQDPVLVAATERLGVSLRMTEDQLIREMLAGTAAMINCVGGVNGKVIAVVKSFLMGLELLTGNAEDNKAQASVSFAA